MSDLAPPFDEEDVRTLRQMLQWMRNFNVVGASFDNTSQGCTIRIPPPPIALRQVIPKPNVVVQIASAISSAGGKYNGTIYGGVMNDDGTGNLSLPDGLTSGDSCLVLNQDEQGQPTHWGIIGSSYNYAAGVSWGTSTETPPRPIILCTRLQYRISSPQSLTGSGLTADPATWNRKIVTSGTDYGDVPLKETYVTRVYWDTAGDVLYYFTRDRIMATDGRQDSETAETIHTVDTTLPCS